MPAKVKANVSAKVKARVSAKARSKNGSAPRFSKTVGNPNDARGLYAAMRRFIEHRAVLGATAASLLGLESYLRDFIEWADARSVTHPEHVTMAVLERYQRWLYYYRKRDGAPLSVSTQRGKVMPLKSLFKWLTRTGQIPANPAAELEMPRNIKSLPRQYMSQAQAEQVLASADTTDILGLRDRAILEVLYATGMRRMELANLHIGDVNQAQCVVIIRQGKGRKDRLIPLGARALYWVQAYLDRSRPHIMWNTQDLTLFLGREGHPLSLAYLSSKVAHYVKLSGIEKQGSCHMFRHTMATLMLENGADIRFIQAMLGHENLDTTQIYTHVVITQLIAEHSRTHPGAARHVRAAQAQAGAGRTDQENAAAALFAALADEANEEGES
jgi:integrase/recombinase XerD